MNIKTNIIRLKETDSTNRWLANYTPQKGEKMTVVVADYQTSGKGQGVNTWESESGKNLLFSILIHPSMIPLHRQFLLSEAGAIALKSVLDRYTGDIALKWPNDVYWKDKKLSGTLIQNTISQHHIKDCIYGIGINVNQMIFKSDAPNPVSLAQILGRAIDREHLLQQIVEAFEKSLEMIENGDYVDLTAMYHSFLYRQKGYYTYRDKDGDFEGAIIEVEDDGHLILHDREGKIRSYAFKEIKFVF